MNTRILTACSLIPFVFAIACSGGRDVELSGTIAADATLAVDAPVKVEVYEVTTPEAGDAGTTSSTFELVDSLTLKELGDFTKTVSVEGEKLHVVAYLDTDQNDGCTDGEAWGEADVEIEGDAVKAAVTVQIVAHATCPVLPAAAK